MALLQICIKLFKDAVFIEKLVNISPSILISCFFSFSICISQRLQQKAWISKNILVHRFEMGMILNLRRYFHESITFFRIISSRNRTRHACHSCYRLENAFPSWSANGIQQFAANFRNNLHLIIVNFLISNFVIEIRDNSELEFNFLDHETKEFYIEEFTFFLIKNWQALYDYIHH